MDHAHSKDDVLVQWLVDSFEKSSELEPSVNAILEGIPSNFDPQLMEDIYLNKEFVRGFTVGDEVVFMLAEKMADRLIDTLAHARFLCKLNNTTPEVTGAVGSTVGIKLPSPIQEELDVVSDRYLQFLNALPPVLAQEAVGHYLQKTVSDDVVARTDKYYSLIPGFDSTKFNHAQTSVESLARMVEKLPESPNKKLLTATINQALMTPPRPEPDYS